MLLGVGREQPQDELQEPPAGAEQGLLRAGAQLVAGILERSPLRAAVAAARSRSQAVIFLWAAGIREAFFSRAGMAGSASIAARAACAPASAELAACSAFFAWA